METKDAILIGCVIGFMVAIVAISMCGSIVRVFLERIEEIVEAVDDHKRWKARRNVLKNSFDLEDIKDWLEKDNVRNVLTSAEFGVWLRHRVSAEIERKIEEARKEVENEKRRIDGASRKDSRG